jgi:hypothetical protein
MLLWIIQITFISIILIFLVHYLINFFKSTLTVPKIKDLVNTPNQKYQSMYNIIKNTDNANPSDNLYNDNQPLNEYTLIDLLPKKEDKPSMKNELKQFLKKQLNTNKQDIDNISLLDSMNNIESFSNF